MDTFVFNPSEVELHFFQSSMQELLSFYHLYMKLRDTSRKYVHMSEDRLSSCFVSKIHAHDC